MTFRSAFLSCVAGATLPVALSAAQLPGTPPRENDPLARQVMRETRVPVTVAGCLRRGSLQLADWPCKDNLANVFDTDVVILDGPKDVLNQLRTEHNLHQDEVSGIAIVQASPDDRTTTGVQTKDTGKGTITAGVRESSGVAAERLAKTVTLRVASFRHLDDKCAIARSPQPHR